MLKCLRLKGYTMINRCLSLIVSVFFLSCSGSEMVSDMDSKDVGGQNPEETPVALMGEFVEDAHPTLGKASINEERTVLSITDFKSDSGPVLEFYLATDLKASKYISLGKLKGLEGDYTYELPSNINYQTYIYLMVWCVDFSVSFGHAVLQ